MSAPNRNVLASSVVVLALLLAISACTSNTGGKADSGTSSDKAAEETTGGAAGGAAGGTSPDGASLVEERCTTCHDTKRIESKSADRAGWTQLVDSMIARGARLDATEREILIGYLAARYPDR